MFILFHFLFNINLSKIERLTEVFFYNYYSRIQLFALNQQTIEPTILLNSSIDRPYLRNKRNSTANAVFSPSRSAVSSIIDMNDDDYNEDDMHDVDLFPTLNTITPRLTMQFSQPH